MPSKLPPIIDNRDANTVLEALKLLLPTLHSMDIPTAILTEPTLGRQSGRNWLSFGPILRTVFIR
jgi:hypothetical protein